MTAGGYGQMRASDVDRDRANSLLQSAYVEGRLTKDEFDQRCGQLLAAQTYAQLHALTADLPGHAPALVPTQYVVAPRRTNSLAVASLACGIGQFMFPVIAAIPAVVLGHIARRQIRESGEEGAGLAMAGLVLGWIGLVLTILVIAAGVALFAVASSHLGPQITHARAPAGP